MSESFLNDRVELHCGDCLEVLAELPENSIDSCCTDPPYHLISIVKRFGAENAAPVKTYKQAYPYGCNFKGSDAPGGGTGAAFARMSKGFMGKQWDGGDIAFRPETWAAVYRVLKPGAHLVAFGGTRTYLRMACAFEDAGFEIRDTVSWLYGSGFPKSHDVSKGIDKRADENRLVLDAKRALGRYLREKRTLSRSAMCRHFLHYKNNESLMAQISNWELAKNVPVWSDWLILKRLLNLDDQFDYLIEDRPVNFIEAERDVVGTNNNVLRSHRSTSINYEINSGTSDITAPATDAARQWAGWGTALKPACELIALARKPLSEGTVAANVLRWGTGAINVDGCRVGTDTPRPHIERRNDKTLDGDVYGSGINGSRHLGETTTGRWPANVVHDGSDEVVGAFPDSNSSDVPRNRSPREDRTQWRNGGAEYNDTTEYGDSGSAARFFYTAKANADDRLGSKHPTVKPLDLMQWLVRLITPKGGLCLDPFAGTGTTGEAAWREGMRAVLIEREQEYQEDIRRRMKLAMGGPEERARESIKAKLKDKPADHGPLFGYNT
jgi:site-specific DNA-methyltransferase (adenine-specific)